MKAGKDGVHTITFDTLADVGRRCAQPHLEAAGFGDPGAAHIVVGCEGAHAQRQAHRLRLPGLQRDLGEGLQLLRRSDQEAISPVRSRRGERPENSQKRAMGSTTFPSDL